MARYVFPPKPRAEVLAESEAQQLVANLRQRIREAIRHAQPGADLAPVLAEAIVAWLAAHPQAAIQCRPAPNHRTAC